MRIPRSYVEAYSRSLNAISDRARRELESRLAEVDWSLAVADVREQVAAIMETCCGASATMAARLAADFYDGLRAEFGIHDGYRAEVDPRRDPKATEGAVRAFAQDLVDGKPVETFVGKCSDRVDRETRLAANRCVEHNARRDPKKPRWARVPTGPETCEFCIMLASRGFVYHSEDLASHAHANCDCRVVPSWDKAKAEVEGYDPSYYLDCYRHPEDHAEIREAINERRRELHTRQQELKRDERIRTRIASAEVVHDDLYQGSPKVVRTARERIDKSIQTAWGRYLDGGATAECYATTVGELVRGLSKMGNLDIEDFVDIKKKGHEPQLASWFADAGHKVLLRNPRSGSDTNDSLIDDEVWELKRLTTLSTKKFKRRITEKLPRQGPNFVVDLSEGGLDRSTAERLIAELLEDPQINMVMLVMEGSAKLFRK